MVSLDQKFEEKKLEDAVRDRFVTGHRDCDMLRRIDSVPPDAPIREIVDRCRVRESYSNAKDHCYVALTSTGTRSVCLKLLLRATAPPPTPAPGEPSELEMSLQKLLLSVPAPAPLHAPGEMMTMLKRRLSMALAPMSMSTPRSAGMVKDWATMVCFSCGRPGHRVSRCHQVNETFTYLLPGWSTEKVGGNYMIISPCVAEECFRAGNGN